MDKTETTEIYFMRHGQCQANADSLVAGRLDSPLTELGRQQAAAAGQAALSEGLRPDVIISSRLQRAAETAKIVAKALGLDPAGIIYTGLLAERSGGSFEGGPIADYYAADEAEAVERHGVESLEELRRRAERLLDTLRRDYSDRRVLLVGHSGIGKMLFLTAANRPAAGLDKRQTLPNALIRRLA